MAYSGTGAPPGSITYVLPGDSAATIQAKMNSVQAGNSLVFTGGATYDFGGATIVGKSGVTVWADGQVVIANAPGAGTHGAFNFSGKTDWTIGGKAAGQGFVFNGSLIDATNAGGNWTIGNCQFNNQQANGYDGSAIRMNGASFGTIINNDFNGVGGNVIGMYDLNEITIDGNHFVDCFEPISIQSPTTADTSLGNNIVIENNVFLGTQRAAIEIGPAPSGSEYFSGLVINNNHFDNFNNAGGEEWSTLLAISSVGQSSENTTITNNYISRGPAHSDAVGVAIEMTGTGEVSGNTIVNFGFAALTYQSGWNFHDNVVYNDGSSPYYGFSNYGSGSGTFGAETILTAAPPAPAKPIRVAWGGSIGGAAPSAPSVTGSLVSDTGSSSTDEITSSAALSGTADANALVRFKVDGASIAATATANASGAWSFTPAGLADGSHTIVASVTNASGVAVSTSLTFTLDTKAPVPVITGATFATGQVTLTGTSQAGSAIAVYEGLTLVGTATAGSDGKWTMTGAGAGNVSHWYGAVATDLAGNVGQTVGDYATAPAAPAAPPKVTAGLVGDTGASASDRVTSNAAIAGTADANAIVRFKVDGASIAATATANASGAWSFTPAGLVDGSHTIVASVTNASGVTASTSLTITLDTKAPVPLITGATFATSQVTLTGTSQAGSAIAVYEGLTLVGTATAGSDGKWTMKGAGAGNVSHWYGAVATDLAGNVGQTASDYATAPSAPAAPPKVTAGLVGDTGSSSTDKLTSSAALSGTADANALVRFKVDGTSIAATATANASGAWSFTPAGLADGSHTIVASVTNASGVTVSTSLTFTLDTKAPVPVITGATFATSQVTLTGTSQAGSAIAVYEGLTLVGTATAGSDGKWTMTGAGAGNVSHWYGAVATDLAGNVGQTAGDYATAPAAPAAPPKVTAGLVGDTGSSSTDKLTSSAALSGTADANALVRFKVDGATIAATATANASGAWSFTPAGLADDSHTIVASVTNASGVAVSTSLTFTLDTKAPVPVITGATFANSQVILTGTSQAGSAIAVYEGLTLVGTATAGSDGKWTMTGAGAGNAPHWYGAVATDLAGNVGQTASDYATAPSAPAAPPKVTAGLVGDTGSSSTDKLTSSAALSGTADANALVRFKVDGASIAATATANASGAWSFTPAGLVDGSHTIVASVTNASGATASTSLTFTLDTKAPVPVITGATFANSQVILTGTSQAGSAIAVYEGLTLVGTATAGSDGKWTMTGAGAGNVSHWYGAVATDLAGNAGHTAGDYATAPSAPAVPPRVTIELVNDSGASASDHITSSAAIIGTADANAVVRFMVDGATIAATATANASGIWSFTPAGLADGGHTIVASETNASGMTGSSLLAFTLDTKPPVPVFTGIVASNGKATLTGSTGGASGEMVWIYDGDSWLAAATTGKNGSFGVTVSANASTTHAYGAIVTDLAGNVGKTIGKAYLGGSRADTLAGTSASDLIQGGANADTMTGGGGADRFVYRAASDSTSRAADIIKDFLHGVDKIDFTKIAGIAATAGVPQFQGKLASTGNVTLKAHGVAYIESGGNTHLLVNTGNTDETVSATNANAADMKIVLVGVNLGLTATDFSHA